MPFGESFITNIKSNKSIILDKSKRFKKTLGGFDSSKTAQFDFPESTPEMLLKIKAKIRKQQRKKYALIAFSFVTILAVFLGWIYFNLII